MARGRDRVVVRRQALAALGRTLSRRAGSACELCGERSGLHPVEVDGSPEPDPDPEWAILACESCRDAMAPKARLDVDALRFLETAIWSDVVPAQVAAVRLSRRVADAGASWARETLDGLYLDPEVEERI